MATKPRKVSYYSVKEFYSEPIGKIYPSNLPALIEFIKHHPKINRKYNISTEKFCLIESATLSSIDGHYEIVMKSAKHSFRPPLINRRTAIERDNPKTIDEGEIEKVHVLLKFDEDEEEAIVYLENNKYGVTINNFMDYLNYFLGKHANDNNYEKEYHFSADIIPKTNFLNELRAMSRVTLAHVFVDKKLLGSPYLNLSSRTVGVKHSIMIDIHSQWGESVKDTAIDCFNKFSSRTNIRENNIHKIRVEGKNEQGSNVILSTDFIGKKETLDIEYNSTTGEINTTDAFRKLNALSNL